METKDEITKRLIQCYLSYSYLLHLALLEARAEIKKYFLWFFGSNEKFRICFREKLTFSSVVKITLCQSGV